MQPAVVAAVTLLLGAAGVATLPSGHLSHGGFVVVAFVSATTLPASACWLGSKRTRGFTANGFVVYADAAITASLLSFTSPAVALPGGELFVIVTLFCIVATSERVFVLHLCAAAFVTAAVVALAVAQGADAWILFTLFIIHVATLTALGFSLSYISDLRLRAGRALRDPLTGLLNRRGLFDAIDAVSDSAPHAPCTRIGVTVADVNAFKAINDQLGHPAGDAVLVDIANRLTTSAPASEVARLGGDEFVVVHHDSDNNNVHARISAVLDRPSGGPDFTVSTGFAEGTVNRGDRTSFVVQELIAIADLKMYRNKNNAAEPDRDLGTDNDGDPWGARDRAAVLRLVEQGGPNIVFQPICHTDGLKVAGFEALSRFPREMGSPSQWFRRAARAGAGDTLELAAVSRAVAQEKHLPDGVFMALNVSASTVRAHDLSPVLTLAATRRPVLLEITEHDLVNDYHSLRASVDSLREYNIGVSIDDVGAGYSTLRHILELEPSMVKIDYSLVHGADTDARKLAAVAMLTQFGHRIGATVVAEGVETAAEQLVMLGADVDYVQGFYISPPAEIS